MAPPPRPGLYAFLLLATTAFVVSAVLWVTWHFYPKFDTPGRFVAWAIVVLSVVGLASVASSLLRLYIRPAIATGRARVRRKGNS